MRQEQNPGAGDGAEKVNNIDTLPLYQSMNRTGNIERHLLEAVKDPNTSEPHTQPKFNSFV
jgi:hypothetical protein